MKVSANAGNNIDEYLNSSSENSMELMSSGNIDYYWENTGESLPKAIDYEDESLLKYLQKGDIIFEAMSAVNHSAIVEGVYYDTTYEQYYVRVIESVKNGGVCRGIVTPERMRTKEGTVYRLTNASETQIDGAFDFIYDQLGKNYEIAVHKNYERDNNDWYCSELIWAAFYHQGIYLDNDDNDQFGSIVWPAELIDHDFAKMIVSYEEETVCTSISSTQHKIKCGDDEVIAEHEYKSYIGYVDKCYGCDKFSSDNANYSSLGFLNCRSQ